MDVICLASALVLAGTLVADACPAAVFVAFNIVVGACYASCKTLLTVLIIEFYGS